ncbi:HAMP domain-containing sensor histidine kinase [Actinocorallia sp. B10E7]|uniref:HAMP domain-containing sensor histidine kinase n=1 Tax=Actinocorallia sp. B10E7 TaxID=3153558 RepID=UPI00325D8950
MRRLTLRGRLALLTAAAVAFAVAACATASWFLVREALYSELDRQLRDRVEGPGPKPRLSLLALDALADCTSEATKRVMPKEDPKARPRNGAGNASGSPWPLPPEELQQVVREDGTRCTIPDHGVMPVTSVDKRVARGEEKAAFHTGTGVDYTGKEIDVRTYTIAYDLWNGERGAVMTALPMARVTGPLNSLALTLTLVSVFGVGISAAAGLLTARASLRPVDRLAEAVEEVARTEDLSVRIPERGGDEVARLSRSFNTMTAALEASRERQRALIADAGHELRTPLTSMKTNIDLLIRSEETGRALPAETKSGMLASLRAQMRELTTLVGDLLQLGSPAAPPRQTGEVAFHEVVRRAVERARLRGPGLTVTTRLDPWYVQGDPDTLERAVVNLCDNAVKFSPPGGAVEVVLRGGELTVRDRGPGISEEDLPHVFERFWRSPQARSLPGSGLGLSIVAQVVQEAGGSVRLERAPGGGTVARLRLPGNLMPT